MHKSCLGIVKGCFYLPGSFTHSTKCNIIIRLHSKLFIFQNALQHPIYVYNEIIDSRKFFSTFQANCQYVAVISHEIIKYMNKSSSLIKFTRHAMQWKVERFIIY